MPTKVFLCWSGTRSRKFAEIVKHWLPRTLGPNVKPSISTQIEKGSEWFDELRSALDNSDCGILCLTAEAVSSPWIHFEAGLLVRALSAGATAPGSDPSDVRERRVFPFLCDVAPTGLTGPLSTYQSTSARDQEDVLRLLEAIWHVIPESERPLRRDLRATLNSQWSRFQDELWSIPRAGLDEVFPEFENLFRRKTFEESMYDCLSQHWLDRYNGARDVQIKLKEREDTVKKACRRFVADVYAGLLTALDSYAMGLSKLLGTPDSPIDDETGRVRFENPGIATACEKQRKRIRALVARLSDRAQEPVFDEAFRFDTSEAFEEKKWLIHHRKTESDKKLARTDNLDWQKSFRERLERCADGLWDFDRIVYYCFQEEGTEYSLAAEINRARRELEKVNAKTENVSLMPLNYSLGPVENALSRAPSGAGVTELGRLCTDIRDFIARSKTDTGGHVRTALSRIESLLTRSNEAKGKA